MAIEATFYCLRCQARFPILHTPREVKERTCPECGSNSVRKETPAAEGTKESAIRISS